MCVVKTRKCVKMNNIQNYCITNYQVGNNKVAFKANVSEPLKNELLNELKQNVGEKYLSRLIRKLENIPAEFTVQDVINTNKGTSFVRLNCNGESKAFEISSNGNKLDIIEGLLKKDKHGTSQLSEFAYRLFGV